MSRFFLNLRSVAYEDPILASRATTGFALDDTSPRTWMTKVIRRKPTTHDTKGTSEDMGTRRRIDEGEVIDILGDRTFAANIDCEAGREILELRPTDGQES